MLLPLFELPGLELGLAVAVLLHARSEAGPARAAAEDLRKVPRPSVPRVPSPGPGAAAAGAIGGATLVLWAAAAVPFLAAVLRAVLSTRCDPFAQAAFFPLLVLPAGLLAAAAGRRSAAPRSPPAPAASRCMSCSSSPRWPGRCGRWCSGRRSSPSTSSSGTSPGPLYDEALRVPASLLWFRLETVLWAVALGTCAAAVFPAPGPTHPRHRGRVLGDARRARAGHRRAGDERGPPRLPQLRRRGAHRPRRTDRDRARGHPLPPREVPRGGGAAPPRRGVPAHTAGSRSSARHRRR